MKTARHRYSSTVENRRRGVQSRLRMIVLFVALSFLTTGCGTVWLGRAGSRGASELSAADESLIGTGKGRLSQIALQSTRVLPKPEFGVTPEVEAELAKFMTRERATVIRVLDENALRYEATKKVFEGQGIPTELLSVAAVESGFNPRAASPAGAKGMWQFMKSTARTYGLKVERSKDERLDPHRSTEAAARHLRDLFINFQDWHLALAAYNAGVGAVNRVVSAQGETDFWELARGGYLPRETRNFVPRVIALSMIFNNPARYGFNNMGAVG